MFDTMTLTKVVGGLCGTFLVFLLGGWLAETIYHEPEHAGEEHQQAYTIEVPEEGSGGGGEAEEEGPAFEEVFANADPAEGEGVFRNCRSCHSIEGENMTGPHLDGVVGREVAGVDGFSYSGALVESPAETWTPENLDAFLEDPQGYAPGTAMTFNGVRRIEDRANLIAWLQSLDG